jgi:hypothetical protein
MNLKDKVLNMIRETMLHDNELEHFTFNCFERQAVFEFAQPNPHQAWPDIQLALTFAGVSSLTLDADPSQPHFAGEVTAFECERTGDAYVARITTRSPDTRECHVHITFTDLSYARDSNRNA